MENTNNILEKWNNAWDSRCIKLIGRGNRLAPDTLYDGRILLAVGNCFSIRSWKEYDVLLAKAGELGFCIETPQDFEFKGDNK